MDKGSVPVMAEKTTNIPWSFAVSYNKISPGHRIHLNYDKLPYKTTDFTESFFIMDAACSFKLTKVKC